MDELKQRMTYCKNLGLSRWTLRRRPQLLNPNLSDEQFSALVKQALSDKERLYSRPLRMFGRKRKNNAVLEGS